MLFFGTLVSFLTRKWKPGGAFRALFFLFGMTIPIVDVPYTHVMHAYYCSGDTGLQVYEEIKPEGHFYVESSYLSVHDVFSEQIEFVEYFDTSSKELWKVTRVDDQLTKTKLETASSKYRYVKEHRAEPVSYGVVKVFSRQITDVRDQDVKAETIWFNNTKPFGWFFNFYYHVEQSCKLNEKSWQLNNKLRNLLVQ